MAKMTIKQCIDFAFQLLNQYSIGGAVVPPSYNDQADTEARMVNLINDAQMQIATTVKPIAAFFEYHTPDSGEDHQPWELVMLPENCCAADAIYFTPGGHSVGETLDANSFKWLDDRSVLLPSEPAGVYRIKYHRYPVRYEAGVRKGSTVLDNTPDTHEIIPYYVAAMVAADENPKMYYSLYNVWETRLVRLGQKQAHAVPTQIEDVYGFGNFEGVE